MPEPSLVSVLVLLVIALLTEMLPAPPKVNAWLVALIAPLKANVPESELILEASVLVIVPP